MNIIVRLKRDVIAKIKDFFDLSTDQIKHIMVSLNVEKSKEFGDLSCNAAMVLAKQFAKKPQELASQLIDVLLAIRYVESVDIAGPGFLNITLTKEAFISIAQELFEKKNACFVLDKDDEKLHFLLEYVSANPTGPLHLGHGRNGIIGDVLSRVLRFLGHSVCREFYINDAGRQMSKLGQSLKVRCKQEFDIDEVFPEGGYQGEYLVGLAKECIKEYGEDVIEKEEQFFTAYAQEKIMAIQKQDLADFGIEFDHWFSEKTLHDSGQVQKTLDLLKCKNLVYKKDGAWWFRSTEFGDDKDRVVKKGDGEFTYIAPDIAYHKNKFDRGYNRLIDVLGQDHHGYVTRLKSTIQALGYNADCLEVILYQMVSIKEGGKDVRMSKRAGKFTTLRDVVDAVGKDVARFFFLNRKADAHLSFDLDVALKKTEENPVFYIQYAYVRTGGILNKAHQVGSFDINVSSFNALKNYIGPMECDLIKKLFGLHDVLLNVSSTYQTHLLSYYTFELAHNFHTYYAKNRIIDTQNIERTKARLCIIQLVRIVFQISLDLLGITKLEKM